MTQSIPLNKGRFALVDDDHYTLVSSRKWTLRVQDGLEYAFTNMEFDGYPKRPVYMHRFIMNASRGQIVDHKDRNGLNNQLSNLRFCSHQENMRNRRKARYGCTSKFIGVSWHKARNKWTAQIKSDNHQSKKLKKMRWIGLFDDEVEAAIAYDDAAREYFGDYASLNFPERSQKNASI